MNGGRLLSALILVLGLLCALEAISAKTSDDVDQQLELITQQVQDGTITSIEILAIPKDVEARISLTPEVLRNSPAVFRMTIHVEQARQRLLQASKNTEVVAFDRDADMRRGIIFYAHCSPVSSMYLDRFDQGQINGVKAKYSGQLLAWVES